MIPTYHDWIAQTEVKLKPRSSALKALDNAILAYSATPNSKMQQEVATALRNWIRYKGAAWESSERNHAPYKAFTKLKAEMDQLGPQFTPEQRMALEEIERARIQKIHTLFDDKRITFRVIDSFIQIREAWQDLKSAKAGVGGGGKAAVNAGVMDAVNNLFGTQVQALDALKSDVIADMGMQSAVEIVDKVLDFIPIVSCVKDGVVALGQWGMAVKKAYDSYSYSGHEFAIESGDARAAFHAVQKLIDRELKFQVAKAGITTVAFGARTALLAAKGAGAVLDPLVGAAKSAATATRVLAKFAIEYRETRRGNKVLKDPKKLNFKAFNECPLLGAYMLICSDTSDLTAMLRSEFGQAGFKENIEKLLQKEIWPVLDKAEYFAKTSPFQIKGVPLHRSISGFSRHLNNVTSSI